MYRFPSGPRCRHSASQIHPYLCDSHLHHAADPNPDPPQTSSSNRAADPHPESSAPPYDAALASDLLSAAGDLTSAADVNHLLRTVYRAMVERRLAPKEASALCYIAQTILSSHRTVSYLEKTAAQTAAAKPQRPRVIINDLPTAIRD
jgi:hypothetical protein